VVDRDHGAVRHREDVVVGEAVVVLDPVAVAVAVEEPDVLAFAQSTANVSPVSMRTPSIATRSSLRTLGLQQAAVASQPPRFRGADHDGRLAIDGHLWCVNLQAADHQSKL
jgi:hypothetical protein